MPTYSYVCDACDHQFDDFHSMSQDPLKKCPNCGKLKLRRLIGAGAGLIFKGSGFYITDYAKKSPSGESGEKQGSKNDSKKDSKTETKKSTASSTSSSSTTE